MLRIPRRPTSDLYETKEELEELENHMFLEWRRSLASLQEVNLLFNFVYKIFRGKMLY